MSDISFNRTNLANIASDFSIFYQNLKIANSTILNEIANIGSNWSGEEYEKAKVELDSIRTNLERIIENSNSINNVLGTTSEGFNQVKYNG